MDYIGLTVEESSFDEVVKLQGLQYPSHRGLKTHLLVCQVDGFFLAPNLAPGDVF